MKTFELKSSEKLHEPLLRTIMRTPITTTIITICFYYEILFHLTDDKLKLFGIAWAETFCIVFCGHWPELLFINYIKFHLPKNIFVLYLVRFAYWYICSIPLFLLCNYVGSILSGENFEAGHWWNFGFVYIFMEMIMYSLLYLRFRKSFWNGVY